MAAVAIPHFRGRKAKKEGLLIHLSMAQLSRGVLFLWGRVVGEERWMGQSGPCRSVNCGLGGVGTGDGL